MPLDLLEMLDMDEDEDPLFELAELFLCDFTDDAQLLVFLTFAFICFF